jgi:response regulator RpfG family c-di-GMP phosphodiesterase
MRLRPLILLVEDDETQLQFAAAIIRSTDRYDVSTAQTAEEALKIAEQTKPDLIISDNYLPGETGVEFCKRIKSHPFLRNTMFMLLTSEQEVGHKILAVDLGADEYVSKPYNADELLTRIRAWVRIAELQRELSNESEELRWANDLFQNTIDGVTNLLARVIAIRVPNASARADIAANMARWMAERLHLDRDTQDQLELAARLHEIGTVSRIQCRRVESVVGIRAREPADHGGDQSVRRSRAMDAPPAREFRRLGVPGQDHAR